MNAWLILIAVAVAAALANAESIGIVFGSASHRGHGVWADAGAMFTLQGVTVK